MATKTQCRICGQTLKLNRDTYYQEICEHILEEHDLTLDAVLLRTYMVQFLADRGYGIAKNSEGIFCPFVVDGESINFEHDSGIVADSNFWQAVEKLYQRLRNPDAGVD